MQVAQFSLLISLLFVNISKPFLCLHHVENHKNRNKRCFKIQDCLQACVIKQGNLHLILYSVYIYLYMYLSMKSLVNSIQMYMFLQRAYANTFS